MTKRVQCPYCFEKFKIEVYKEDGDNQSFVYDCEICCNPIDIQLTVDPETHRIILTCQKL